MCAAIKPLIKKLQSHLKPEQQSDWALLREILLQASGDYLWHSVSPCPIANQTPIPELIQFSKYEQNTELQKKLHPLIAGLFSSLGFWQKIELFARLNEECIPAEIRRQQGIFYTPDTVVDFLVHKSLKHIQLDPLKPFAFLDPACGSGLFLIGVLKAVLEQYPDLSPETTANWILSAYGCDIDEQAIAVTGFCLCLIWRHYLPVQELPEWNVRCLNPLEKEVNAENTLWKLQQSFPELKQKMRLLISNPPYVGERFHRELFEMFKSPAWVSDYVGRSDLYYYFFYLALGLAKEELICALLTPRYYFSASAARHLRSRLQAETHILELIDFDELKLFAGAMGHHNAFCLFDFDLKSSQTVAVRTSSNRGILRPTQLEAIEATVPLQIPQTELFQGIGLNITWSHQDGLAGIFKQMQAGSDELKSHFQVSQGIVSGADSLSPRNQQRYQIHAESGQGIFVLTQSEYTKLAQQLSPLERQQWLVPWIKNSDIAPWRLQIKHNRWLIYADRNKQQIPRALLTHLEPFRALLEQRREVKLGRILWWQLQWPREQSLFESPKLLLPQRARVGLAALSKESYYASADVYFIRAGSLNDLWFLCALLNSPLLSCWWYTMGKRKGNLLELYYEPLQQTPVPADFKDLSQYSELTELSQLMYQKSSEAIFAKMHEDVCQLFGLNGEQSKIVWENYQAMLSKNKA